MGVPNLDLTDLAREAEISSNIPGSNPKAVNNGKIYDALKKRRQQVDCSAFEKARTHIGLGDTAKIFQNNFQLRRGAQASLHNQGGVAAL